MGTYTRLGDAIEKARLVVLEAGGKTPRKFKSVIQVETDVEYECVFIVDEDEVIGAVIEALTQREGVDLIYPLTSVLCNDIDLTADEFED
jgi:hypothetical protein